MFFHRSMLYGFGSYLSGYIRYTYNYNSKYTRIQYKFNQCVFKLYSPLSLLIHVSTMSIDYKFNK